MFDRRQDGIPHQSSGPSDAIDGNQSSTEPPGGDLGILRGAGRRCPHEALGKAKVFLEAPRTPTGIERNQPLGARQSQVALQYRGNSPQRAVHPERRCKFRSRLSHLVVLAAPDQCEIQQPPNVQEVVVNQMMHQQDRVMRIAWNREGTVATKFVPHVLREQQVRSG
jgi:hypothetical protein